MFVIADRPRHDASVQQYLGWTLSYQSLDFSLERLTVPFDVWIRFNRPMWQVQDQR